MVSPAVGRPTPAERVPRPGRRLPDHDDKPGHPAPRHRDAGVAAQRARRWRSPWVARPTSCCTAWRSPGRRASTCGARCSARTTSTTSPAACRCWSTCGPSASTPWSTSRPAGDCRSSSRSCSTPASSTGTRSTCTGETLAEQVRRLDPPPPDQDVIYPVDKPFKDTGGLRLLRGNLAPEGGAILKVAGVEGGVKDGVFTGRARVFNSERSLVEALECTPRPSRTTTWWSSATRGRGVRPGMPELLDPTSRITALCRERGITIALMTDARFSGGSVGLVIGHVAPEAFLGGPIALVEDGDTIVVDVMSDRIDCRQLDEPGVLGAARRRLADQGRGRRRRPPRRGAGHGPGAGADAGDRAARPPRRGHGDAVAG